MASVDYEAFNFFWVVIIAVLTGIVLAAMWVSTVKSDIKALKSDVEKLQKKDEVISADIKSMSTLIGQMTNDFQAKINELIQWFANMRGPQ